MIRVDGVTLHRVRLPLVRPFQTSFGRTVERETFLVEARAAGLTGWGELTAHEAPIFSYEDNETALHVLREFLVPALFRTAFDHPAEFDAATRGIRGHAMAKAALLGALYDLTAQAAGVSLSAFLGGVRDEVPVGVSLGIESDIPTLLERVAEFQALGYRRVKLKIKPGWDVDVLGGVRAHWPALPLTADANAAYTAADIPHLKRLDALDLVYLEQPLGHDDLVEHARLQKEMTTDLCLDESISGFEACRAALALGSGRIINIKLGRVGGHGEARRIHDLCQGAGVSVWCGGMLETGVGRAHNVAMATLPNFLLPGDSSASDRYYHEDLIDPPFRLTERGTLAAPTGPGLGVWPVPERLSAATIQALRLKP